MTSNIGRYPKPPRTAIIVMPAGGTTESTARCLDHVAAQTYGLLGICHGYAAAKELIDAGKADIIVVDQRSDIPADRLPRIEVVAEFVPITDPRQRRPVLINRRGAEA